MAEATLGRSSAIPRATIVAWASSRSDLLIIGSLMLVALLMRLWNLGDMALHHDESLHAQYSWYLYDRFEYNHNPLMHGPFLFHSGALVFFLFGDSDMTARLLVAVFGSVLVGMPYLLRKQIGMPAVIIAAVLLMFSPTLFYFGRFFRNDIYIAVWTLGMVICIWRYLDEMRDRWLYGLAALMALSFATKETTFITIAIMLVFIDLMLAVELGKRRAGEEITNAGLALRTAAIAPFAWLIAAFWPLVGPRLRFGRESLPPVGDVLVVVGVLSLPQFAAGIQVLPFVGDRGYNVPEEDVLRISTVAALLIAAAYVGLMWRPRTFVIVAVCFFVPYTLLYTTLLTNPDGFFSGIWGSLDYWLDQHHVKRGDQPQYYYALLTPLYEFLPLLIGAAGAMWLLLRGDALRRWLVFWTVWTFVGLSIAGEKMPWLEVHIALPLALMAAVTLARAIALLDIRGARWVHVVALAGTTAGAVLLMVECEGAAQVVGYLLAAAVGVWLLITLATGLDSIGRRAPEAGDDPAQDGGSAGEAGLAMTVRAALASTELLVTLAALALGAALIALASIPGLVDPWFSVWVVALVPIAIAGYAIAGLAAGRPAFGRALLSVGVAALLTLTVRAGVTLTYENYDTPVEMLVYTQSSPDIPVLRDRIDALAERSGLGSNLQVIVDEADSFAWPWAWYLRDYNNVGFPRIDANYVPPQGAVLLVNRRNTAHIDGSQYSQAPYRHRWWFDETYRNLSFKDATDILLDSSSRSALFDFFLYRRDLSKTGSIDGVAFFPNDLSSFDSERGADAPPREPAVMADGRIVIGSQQARLGSAVHGEFWQPAGLHVDGEGNLWVADSLNHRIQKFDADGNFVTAFGREGTAPGLLKEPWGVAVDSEGNVYVADTWNHRVQKFSPDFEFVTSWGEPGTDVTDPENLFGPRDIAIGADGMVWVTDTGNQRLLLFSPDGEALEVAGSKAGITGFSEPVSVALDASGDLLVTSTWASSIVRLSPTGEVQDTIDVGWTSQLVLDKPYITVLADGRILVTRPESGELVLYESDGTQLGVWQPMPQSRPIGVAAMPEGGFAFSDVSLQEVQIVTQSLVEELFQ